MATKTDALLADEAPIYEIDELRPLIAEGQERGTLTVEQIAASLEDATLTQRLLKESSNAAFDPPFPVEVRPKHPSKRNKNTSRYSGSGSYCCVRRFLGFCAFRQHRVVKWC